MKEKIMNIKELAIFLNCSVSTIRKLIKEKRIPHFRIGAKIYFRLSEIERWIYKLEIK